MEAVTLADLATGVCTRVWVDCVGVNQSLTHRSTWEFPVEKLLSQDKDWWQMGLLSITSTIFKVFASNALGTWIQTLHRAWEWFYSPTEGTFFCHVFDVWHCYLSPPPKILPDTKPSFRAPLLTQHQSPFYKLLPPGWTRIALERHMVDMVPPPLPSTQATIHDFICSCWLDNWPLQHSFFTPLPLHVTILAIQEGQAHAVCDGS
jgi:hypothetical protein